MMFIRQKFDSPFISKLFQTDCNLLTVSIYKKFCCYEVFSILCNVQHNLGTERLYLSPKSLSLEYYLVSYIVTTW